MSHLVVKDGHLVWCGWNVCGFRFFSWGEYTSKQVHTLFSCLHVYMSTCLRVYLCTCLHVYLCTCLHVYLCTCLHVYLCTCLPLFNPMLFLDLGNIKCQRIQNLMEIASRFVQPRHCIPEFLCAHFLGQAITNPVAGGLQQVRR